jgi:enoyl-CoA hydratase/carnithine racemase
MTDELHIERREVSGHLVEVWTIDREPARNALNQAVVQGIGAACRRVDADREVRGVVLTGRGDKAFCAGADLKERRGMSEADVRNFLALYRTEFRFLDRLSKPVVAAISGAALGGGLELALTCDFRVAASHAEVGLTEVSLGIIPGAGGTQRLTHLVGPHVAKELLLTSRRLSAAEAHRLGLLHRVAAEGQSAVDAAIDLLEPMLHKAPIAVAAALEAVDAAVDQSLEEGLVTELRLYERTLVSQDRLEALAAFAEKRKPRFEGR